MSEYTVRDEEELETIAEEILEVLPQRDHANVIGLTGDLGAGKTAFAKALAKELGITEHVTSPTFVVMKSYEVSDHAWIKTLTHIDAYRIEDIDEMRVLKLDELYQDPSRVVCIEWPERIEELIPLDALRMQFVIEKDGSRTITYAD